MRKNFHYTEEQEKWIINNSVNFYSLNELHINFMKKFNVNVNFKAFKTKCHRLNAYLKQHFTKEQDDYIINLILQKKCYLEITKLFNKKFNTDKTKEAIMARVTKRLKSKIIYTKENIKRTIFIKQHPVGTIITTSNGKGKKQILIKIKEIPENHLYNSSFFDRNYWMPYAQFVYEQYYGYKLKENENVYHLDGNYENNNIDNLIVGTLGSLGYANGKLYRGEKPRPETKTDSEKKVALILGCLNYEMRKVNEV